MIQGHGLLSPQNGCGMSATHLFSAEEVPWPILRSKRGELWLHEWMWLPNTIHSLKLND